MVASVSFPSPPPSLSLTHTFVCQQIRRWSRFIVKDFEPVRRVKLWR